MLPVVDPNWTLDNNVDLALLDFYVLRAVAVQIKQPYVDALENLRLLSKRAETPGSGGLPHAVITYCDIAGVNALEQLAELSSNVRVAGISYELDLTEISSIQDSLGYLSKHAKSIDITCGTGALKYVEIIANNYPTLTIILNISQIPHNNRPLGVNQWVSSVSAFSRYPNVFIKVTGYSTEETLENESSLSNVLHELTQFLGVDRLMLASGSINRGALRTNESLWTFYSLATRWASASERNKLFRNNAMQVYKLS